MAQIILDSNSNLIQGDFDSATVNNRTKLQTSTSNAATGVYIVPNGSATSAAIQMSNAADPTNASKIVVTTNGSTDTQIVSGVNGTGTYLPLSFYTNNDIRFQMNNSGALGVRTGVGAVGFGTSGQVLTSAGSGASPTWSTPATPPGAMTLLGTITPTAVNSISLGSLTLTSYKSLYIVFNNILTNGTGMYISADNSQTNINAIRITGSGSPAGYGTMWNDLGTGSIGGAIGNNTSAHTIYGPTGILTSSTTIYFRCSSTNLWTAQGSIVIYGVT